MRLITRSVSVSAAITSDCCYSAGTHSDLYNCKYADRTVAPGQLASHELGIDTANSVNTKLGY